MTPFLKDWWFLVGDGGSVVDASRARPRGLVVFFRDMDTGASADFKTIDWSVGFGENPNE